MGGRAYQDDARSSQEDHRIIEDSSTGSIYSLDDEDVTDYFTGGLHRPTADIGDMEGLASLIKQVKVDKDGTGEIDPDEAKEHEETLKTAIDASANFLLNMGVVGTLLLSIQLPLLLAEAQPHMLVEVLTKKICGTLSLGEDDYFREDDSTAYQSIEVNWALLVLQQLASLFMLRSVYTNFRVVMETIKGYGHLTWWCVEPESQTWFMNAGHIVEFQGLANHLLPQFIKSLSIYALLTRGPLGLVACLVTYIFLRQEYQLFQAKSCSLICGRYALRVQKEKLRG